MRREEKYPETDTFVYFNANPKGRVTCDCWLRAVCTGLGESYNKVLKEMCDVHLKTGYELSGSKAVDIYLQSKGWRKHRQPRMPDNTKYTGREFCRKITANGSVGNVICNIGGNHMVAILPVNHGDGPKYKIHDTWDSTGGCIGNYWTKAGGVA